MRSSLESFRPLVFQLLVFLLEFLGDCHERFWTYAKTMKPLLAPALALLTLPLFAQTPAPTTTAPATTTATPPPTGGGYAQMMEQATSTLTPQEKEQLTAARTKAMAQNPDLQTEEMDLMQKVMTIQQGGDVTDADKQALRAAMRAHGDKVRAAMIKVDPAVEAVIKKVEAEVEKLRAEAQAVSQ
jgi:Spy/CpxP family protein refolding chaperone